MTKRNLVGQVFGRLTVLEDTGKRYKNGSVIWKCQCSCEERNIVEVVSGSLTSGGTKSCGCLHKEKAKKQGIKAKKDLTGKHFGKLTVLQDSGKRKNGCVVWICQCSCEKHSIVEATTGNLQSGHAKSCGCLIGHHTKYNVGDIIGKLTLIEKTNKRTNNGDIIWRAKCNCGNLNILEVTSVYLATSPYPSCGCASSSCGESKIQDCLIEMHISFQKEYRFLDCINPKTKYPLPFDFYLPNYNTCIEYDGEQHFKERLNGFYTKEKLEELKNRDKIKTNYCDKNNINLIRISYTDFNKIDKNYLSEKIKQGRGGKGKRYGS